METFSLYIAPTLHHYIRYGDMGHGTGPEKPSNGKYLKKFSCIGNIKKALNITGENENLWLEKFPYGNNFWGSGIKRNTQKRTGPPSRRV